MKLYLLTQDTRRGYDTYDSLVVAANTEDEARTILPNGRLYKEGVYIYDWATPSEVEVEYLGEAKEGTEVGVILSSLNAG